MNVGGQLVAVGQEGAPCRFDLERTKVQVAPDAATFDLDIQGPTGCAWTATSEADWLVVSQGAQGSGPGRVAFRVSANAGPERRGTVVVAGVRVEVTQGAVGGSLPPSSAAATTTTTTSSSSSGLYVQRESQWTDFGRRHWRDG